MPARNAVTTCTTRASPSIRPRRLSPKISSFRGRQRLLDAVKEAAAKIPAGQEVKLVARVSEGPEERRKLTEQLQQMLGAHASVEVLCAFKQGYSWLMDEIAPALAGKHVASLRIEFAKNVDPTNIRAMQSEARWVQELYPVDEMLARKLNIPLEKITSTRSKSPPPTPLLIACRLSMPPARRSSPATSPSPPSCSPTTP